MRAGLMYLFSFLNVCFLAAVNTGKLPDYPGFSVALSP